MFTGLVADLGAVLSIAHQADGAGARARIATALAEELVEGDSIAVNGVCLTALSPSAVDFEADVIAETLQRSSLGALEPGGRVNLELPLRAGDRLGGHIVQGHVDGVGSVQSLSDAGELRLSLDQALLRFVVAKGSIALDGVSLTVARVDEWSLTVCLIPETLRATTLGGVSTGSPINVEVDIMAKQLEKLAATSAISA